MSPGPDSSDVLYQPDSSDVLHQPDSSDVLYYTIVNGSGEGGSGATHFPVTVSSEVVSGLQEGQWYQFSISFTLNVSAQWNACLLKTTK